ncbi:TetR/AcrR family transcriptional regulator [Alkalibacterium sp. f15]|uniref:TetR/AcrR family transcriptional regulator n=1 Tax=Alkalibacterium sp. f15 TaxID=3414029 RepID=UPI003BF8D750
MPRKRRILKEHILDAALELIKDEGFNHFTARRIAEYLNASTQPIYKEFKNMDDLKENLLDYVKEIIRKDVFNISVKDTRLDYVCANYIRFAKEEGPLFCALFLGGEAASSPLHECAFLSLNQVMDQMKELDEKNSVEKKAFLDIVWPSIHGMAVLTAQGQYEFTEKELVDKANHIVAHSLITWKNS